MKVFQSTDNEEEMESENLKSNEGNVSSIDKGKTEIEINTDEPESTKQMKNVKLADQSDRDMALIEEFTQNEIPNNIQEKSIKIEADEYTDFHLDDLIA